MKTSNELDHNNRGIKNAFLLLLAILIFNLHGFKLIAQDSSKEIALVCYISVETKKSICDDNTFPIDYSKLKNTTNLEINGNSLKVIPSEIFKLSQIEELSVNSSSVATLSPDIAKLYNLRILNLDNTSISELPEEISMLLQLKEIHLPYSRWIFRLNEVKKITKAVIVLE